MEPLCQRHGICVKDVGWACTFTITDNSNLSNLTAQMKLFSDTTFNANCEMASESDRESTNSSSWVCLKMNNVTLTNVVVPACVIPLLVRYRRSVTASCNLPLKMHMPWWYPLASVGWTSDQCSISIKQMMPQRACPYTSALVAFHMLACQKVPSESRWGQVPSDNLLIFLACCVNSY